MASVGKLKAGVTLRNASEPSFDTPDGKQLRLERQARAGVSVAPLRVDRRRRLRHPGDRRSVRTFATVRGRHRGTGLPEGHCSRRVQPQYDGRSRPLLQCRRQFRRDRVRFSRLPGHRRVRPGAAGLGRRREIRVLTSYQLSAISYQLQLPVASSQSPVASPQSPVPSPAHRAPVPSPESARVPHSESRR